MSENIEVKLEDAIEILYKLAESYVGKKKEHEIIDKAIKVVEEAIKNVK